MNCLEFRRQLATDPQSADADYVRHRQECSGCADAHTRALGFENSLRRALNVPVPAQLAESILLSQATAEQRQRVRLRRRGVLFAAAASIVLAFGVGMRISAQPLPALAVGHLEGEASVLQKVEPVADADVREAFKKMGIAVDQVPAGISFVACCPVGRVVSVHMVMPETNGPVTVLYLPDRQDARSDFVRDGWLGRSVPIAHGTLVFLAHETAHFDQLENIWRIALQGAAKPIHASL
jgi:hypothetical protein